MSEFKGTKGEVIQNGVNGVHTKDGSCVVLTYGEHRNENATMIADAFKVRQQINCELSELLDMNKEMLAMLNRAKQEIEYLQIEVQSKANDECTFEELGYEIEQLIKKQNGKIND